MNEKLFIGTGIWISLLLGGCVSKGAGEISGSINCTMGGGSSAQCNCYSEWNMEISEF